MSAFLYLPTRHDAAFVKRVDLSNIGALFSGEDEPLAMRRPAATLRRALLATLIVLFAFGDLVLLDRSDSIGACLFRPAPTADQTTT